MRLNSLKKSVFGRNISNATNGSSVAKCESYCSSNGTNSPRSSANTLIKNRSSYRSSSVQSRLSSKRNVSFGSPALTDHGSKSQGNLPALYQIYKMLNVFKI